MLTRRHRKLNLNPFSENTQTRIQTHALYKHTSSTINTTLFHSLGHNFYSHYAKTGIVCVCIVNIVDRLYALVPLNQSYEESFPMTMRFTLKPSTSYGVATIVARL
jgi:hypothetical protein